MLTITKEQYMLDLSSGLLIHHSTIFRGKSINLWKLRCLSLNIGYERDQNDDIEIFANVWMRVDITIANGGHCNNAKVKHIMVLIDLACIISKCSDLFFNFNFRINLLLNLLEGISVFNGKHNSSWYKYKLNDSVGKTKYGSSHITISSCKHLKHPWDWVESEHLPELQFIIGNDFNVCNNFEPDKRSWNQRNVWNPTLVAEDVKDTVVW